ncbi:M4 family peptidase [Pseudonocardiaceae bacterium YIM PH 21723]|nr:M4 family peptidase [Pseudonocardiaceae bacterium YIM PH 21723]
MPEYFTHRPCSRPSPPCTEGQKPMTTRAYPRHALKALLATAVVAAAVLSYQAPELISTDNVAVTATGDVRGLIPAQPIEADKDKIVKSFKTDETDVRTVDTNTLPDGSTIVRQQQYIDGVPVYGGQIVENRTKDGKLSAALGKVTKASDEGTFPADGEEKAKQAAVAKFGGQATKAEKVWFDPTLADKAGDGRAYPAYQVTTAGTEHGIVAIVRAADNSVPLSWATHHEAQNRVVCDANRKKFNTSTATDSSPWRCGTVVKATRSEGGAASSVADVNNVYDFFGDTTNTYAKLAYDLTAKIGADWGDGKGKALRATVRGCDTQECPYVNAFWFDGQMFFGEGVTTDDVAAHELTHGVTENTSNLNYQSESGAINEALSDIFGEFTDLANGSSDDTAANRWLIGEGSSLGAIRDMKTPENKGQPGYYKGPNWYTGSGDNGGVHYNSGVGNKLAFLIADGGSYNSQTVKGLGLDKSLQLWWATQLSLTATSNYADLGRAVNASCTKYAQAGTAGITTADCAEVAKAVKAVKIG